jgi:hypothetical protein
MILNSQIWQQTISDAKAKSAHNPAILRAIDRAVKEIEKSSYWSFDGQTLRLQSTTSRKLYVVDDAHTCEAQSKTCKHHIARRLMLRYTQRLAVAAAKVETKKAQNWQAGVRHSVVETKRVMGRPPNSVKARRAVRPKRSARARQTRDFTCLRDFDIHWVGVNNAGAGR